VRFSRIAGLSGLVAVVTFWIAIIIFGALRPYYSQTMNAISELGALGTANALPWNVLGLVVPGVLLAVAGKTIGNSLSQSRSARLGGWLLAAFGIAAAAQGLFPADMTGGALVVKSWHTRTHLAMSLLSGLAWIAAVLFLVAPTKRDPRWRGFHLLNLVAVLLVVLGFAIARRFLPDGLAQRSIDAILFTWFLVMSFRLVFLGTTDSGDTIAQPRA